MNPMPDFPDFTPEQYLFWSRIQGTLWTTADIILCFYLIRLANLFRTRLGTPTHRLPMLFLGLTLPPALLIPLAPNGTAFFRLEILVTIPHFLIILYVAAVNYSSRAACLRLLFPHVSTCTGVAALQDTEKDGTERT